MIFSFCTFGFCFWHEQIIRNCLHTFIRIQVKRFPFGIHSIWRNRFNNRIFNHFVELCLTSISWCINCSMNLSATDIICMLKSLNFLSNIIIDISPNNKQTWWYPMHCGYSLKAYALFGVIGNNNRSSTCNVVATLGSVFFGGELSIITHTRPTYLIFQYLCQANG